MYINDSDFTGCMIVVVLAVILAPLGIWKLVEWLWPSLVSDEGEEMGDYAEYALSDWFEVAQEVQTTGYWSAVFVAGTWLHKISLDGRWK